MSHDYTGIEDLLFATLPAVSRFRVGQREAVGAALDAGGLLTEAKGRLKHGEWGDWIGRVGLASRTASMWMKLAGLDLTASEVIARGGIVQTLRGGAPNSATVAELQDRGRDLAEAEAEIADTKQAYYDALSRRNRALRALAREREEEVATRIRASWEILPVEGAQETNQ